MKFKTKGNSSEKGKQRIYYAAHSEDHAKFLDVIAEKIFKVENCAQNCAIYYDEDPENPGEPEYFKDRLAEMQLIVIPLTPNFVNEPECFAYSEVFMFSTEDGHHIPVLPLLMMGDDYIDGLDLFYDYEDDISEVIDKFNDLCGGLQYLSPYINDSSAISFEEKLERYLNAVIVGDREAEAIRNRFAGYIFLSYRKKDRKLANDLMKKIHSLDCARDTAVWYDEFLVPGEDFDVNINKAIGKCRLFMLLVTPNLLAPAYDSNSEPVRRPDGKYKMNFVIENEIPTAVKLQKPLIAAEMADTDKNRLLEAVRESAGNFGDDGATINIDTVEEALISCTDPMKSTEFEERLIKKLGYGSAQDGHSDPEHIYYIGLAYLYGVDVEKNIPKAVELLNEASKSHAEAARKLSDIYYSGIGVRRDHALALEKKLLAVRLYGEKYSETGITEDGVILLQQLFELSEMYAGLCDDAGLNKTVAELSEKAGDIYKRTGNIDAFLYSVKTLYEEGRIYLTIDPDKAYGLFERAYKQMETYEGTIEGRHADHYCGTAEKICGGLAEAAFYRHSYEEALGYNEQRLKIIRDNLTALGRNYADTAAARTEAAIGRTYFYMGKGIGGAEGAQLTEKAERITEDAIKKYRYCTSDRSSADIISDTLLMSYELGDIYSFRSKYEPALKRYKESIELAKKLDEERGLPADHLVYADAFLRISKFYSGAGRQTRAIRYLEKLYHNAKTWNMEKLNTVNRFEYSGILISASRELKKAGFDLYAEFLYKTAYEMLENCPEVFPGITDYRIECLQSLAVFQYKTGNDPLKVYQACEYSASVLKLSGEAFLSTGDESDFRTYVYSCYLYEEFMRESGKYRPALETFYGMIAVLRDHFSNKGISLETCRNIALCAFSAGLCHILSNDREGAQSAYSTAMYYAGYLKNSQIPAMRDFANAVSGCGHIGQMIESGDLDRAEAQLFDRLHVLREFKNKNLPNLFEDDLGDVYYWLYVISAERKKKSESLYFCEKCRQIRQHVLNYTLTESAYRKYIAILAESVRTSNESGYFKEAEYMCLKFDRLSEQLLRKFGLNISRELSDRIDTELSDSRELMEKAAYNLKLLMDSMKLTEYMYCDLSRMTGNYTETMKHAGRLADALGEEGHLQEELKCRYMLLHCAMINGKYAGFRTSDEKGDDKRAVSACLSSLVYALLNTGHFDEADLMADENIDIAKELFKEFGGDIDYMNLYHAYAAKAAVRKIMSDRSEDEEYRHYLFLEAVEYLEKTVYWAEEAVTDDKAMDEMNIHMMNELVQYCTAVVGLTRELNDEGDLYYRDIYEEYEGRALTYGIRVAPYNKPGT